MKLRLLGAVVVLALLLVPSRAQSGAQYYIVTLKAGYSIASINEGHGTQTVRNIAHTSVYLIEGWDQYGSDTLLKNLQNDPGVESAEANKHVQLRSNQPALLNGVLSAALASQLDGQTATSFFGTTVLEVYVNQPALALTHINDVRNISTGAGTRVAYIDTGVDPYHPALRPWLDPGIDLLNNTGTSEFDGLPERMESLQAGGMGSLLDEGMESLLDEGMESLLDGSSKAVFPSAFGHGTLVAGIIHVVAPNARIVPIKAFDAYGNTSMFRIIEGVYAAESLGVDVLNMSFSTDQDSVTLRKAIIEAASSGVAIAAAVGNNGTYLTGIYPASDARVIGVGATDFKNRIANFSNYGSPVSVMAPGAFVVSTVPGGRYAAAWGTSFSAPIVSGTLALVASTGGHGHSESSNVVNTAVNIDSLNPGYAGQLGKGLVDARQALGNGN